MDADDGGGEKKQMREAHGGLGLAGPPAKYKTQLEGPGQRISLHGIDWHTGIAFPWHEWLGEWVVASGPVSGRQWSRSLVASIRAAAAAAGTGLGRFVSTGQGRVSTPLSFWPHVIGPKPLALALNGSRVPAFSE